MIPSCLEQYDRVFWAYEALLGGSAWAPHVIVEVEQCLV